MADKHGNGHEQFEQDVEEALRDAGTDRLPPPRPLRRRAGPSIDLRPSSPGQVMIAGGVLLLVQWLGLAVFMPGLVGTVGLALLGFGFLTWLLRPRRHQTYWRGRPVEWDAGPSWAEAWYYRLYRH